MWARLARRLPDGHDRLERWTTPDGDAVTVARVDSPRPDAPMLALLHGLEGTLRSKYALGLMRECRSRGWGLAMLLWRTCDGRVPAAPRLYHSGETGDADLFLRRLSAEVPGRETRVIGVSLGANVLLKWLGEVGDRLPTGLRAAAAVSTPFDLAAGSRKLEARFSRIYAWHFVRQLKGKALASLAVHPALPVDRERVLSSRTFWEFDDAFTAPVHGFTGADDYYARSSSIGFLKDIRLPTLLYSAFDDPFLPRVVLEEVQRIASANPQLETCFTAKGGHVGWVAGPPWAPRYTMEQRVPDWLESH